MSSENDFEDQLKQLQEQAEAAVRKRDWLKQQKRIENDKNAVQLPREKKIVSPQEYSDRLKNSLAKDSRIVKKVSDDRIANSLAEWRKKVGPTFAGANTQHDFILRKVSYLGTVRQHQTSLVMAGDMGVGKAQPVSEPVVLPDGSYKPIGELRLGEHVVTVTGEPTEVIGVHRQGERRIYLVAFDEGSRTYADEEHLWFVRKLGTDEWLTVTTEFLAGLDSVELGKYEIPVTQAVQFSEVELPMEPYLLGSLVVDRDRFKDIPFPQNGLSVKDDALAVLGMRGKSYEELKVPVEYRMGSVKQRLDFLQGIFDSAGFKKSDGRYGVSTRNSELKSLLVNLVQSLGGIVKVKEKHGLHTLYPVLPKGVSLFSESSEFFECFNKSSNALSPSRNFLKVRYSRTEQAVCISVAHESHLYLTRNFIVTHNTWNAYAYLNKALMDGKATAGQIVAGSEMSLLGNISRSGFRMEEKWDALLNPSAKVYFIDDVGKGSFMNKEGRTAAWYSLVDHIYTHQLTIILTTNLSFEGKGVGSLYEWVGAAAYDRIKTMAGENFIPSTVNKRETVWKGDVQPGSSSPGEPRKPGNAPQRPVRGVPDPGGATQRGGRNEPLRKDSGISSEDPFSLGEGWNT